MTKLTALDVMYPAPMVLSLDEKVSVHRARDRAEAGQIILIERKKIPYGLLTEENLQKLSDPVSALGDYWENFELPVLTRPDTPLSILLGGLEKDPLFRWYLIREGKQIKGVVSPRIRMLANLPAPARPGKFKLLGHTFSSEIFGNPLSHEEIQNLEVCYCCSKDPSHDCISLDTARNTPGFPHVLCPQDSTPMLPMLPCRRNDCK